MKRSFLTTLLGCLLFGAASVLVSTRDSSTRESAGKPLTTRSRDRQPRPARGVSPARLLESTRQYTPDHRDAWARSLDKPELRSVTLALINAYQKQPKSQNDLALWLTPLTKEWGRRDIDSLFKEMNSLGPEFFTNTQGAWFVFSKVREAGLIGLSETDPAKAFRLMIHPEVSDSMYLIYMGGETSGEIFRNWAKQDAAQAWYELSNSSVAEWSSFEAVRSLIANCSDPRLHEEILQWVAAYKRPDNSPTSGSFIISAAFGFAERDPEKAWAWLQSQSGPDNGDSVKGSELFESSAYFLSVLAGRKPQEAIALMDRHPDQITVTESYYVGITLLNYEPETGLEVLAKVPDLEWREKKLSNWIGYALNTKVYTEWTLEEQTRPHLLHSESFRRIIENLDRLGLSESSTAALRLKLEKQIADHSHTARP
jgi:hypothetical protein